MPSVFVKTYGCQMNERDSEQVVQMLQAQGFTVAPDEHGADVVLLNTCSVRDQAEQKALGKMGLLQHLKRERPDTVLGYLGCMAQRRGTDIRRDQPHVDLVVGTQRFHRVADHVAALRQGAAPIVDVAEEAGSQSTIRDHHLAPHQTTAFVSIMQGCDMFCTFCIVPFTRGRERSRSMEDIVAEVHGLVARGIKEVTLLGQIVNLYGRHEFPTVDGASPFVQLLHRLNGVPGLERIRFTSPHPAGLKPDLIQAFAELDKLCEHMHLPAQSGSNRVLRAMHRSYTRELYLRKVEALRRAVPGIALTTDLIVGFPGETDVEFDQTRSLVEEVGFDNAFIFRYSPRSGTPAERLADQVPEPVKEARNQELLRLLDRLARAKGDQLIGTRQQILVEGPSKNNPDRLSGRTRTNKIVVFEGDPRHVGQLLDVQIVRSTGFTLYGDPVLHL